MREVTLDDFRLAQHLGVEGFPTLVLHRRDEQGRDHLALVGRGYEEAGPLIERIERALAQPLEASVPSG